MEKIDFSKANPNDFTQKDLMIHLLNVSQHTVTREEVKDDISNLDKRFDSLETSINQRFEQADKRVNSLEISINQRFEQVDKRFEQIDTKIDKLDGKFDKLQWFLVAGALIILFKEQILNLLG